MQTQPTEDIETVLGRFQAWAGARNAVEAKPGVRELSYEEALQSSRYRWKGANARPRKSSRTETGDGSSATPDTASQQKPTRAETAPVKDHDAKPKASRGEDSKGRATKASLRTVNLSIAKEAPDANPRFREVLAEAVRPAQVVVAAQPVGMARHTAISIRLAPAERALIRTRAAEAGISASAYMRQCALEVEHLRTQVKQALAAMERNAPAPIQAPAPVPSPGFFARLAQKIF